MKLRYLYLIPTWLMVKIPDFENSRETNDLFKSLTLSAYGKGYSNWYLYIVNTLLWVILATMLKALLF